MSDTTTVTAQTDAARDVLADSLVGFLIDRDADAAGLRAPGAEQAQVRRLRPKPKRQRT